MITKIEEREHVFQDKVVHIISKLVGASNKEQISHLISNLTLPSMYDVEEIINDLKHVIYKNIIFDFQTHIDTSTVIKHFYLKLKKLICNIVCYQSSEIYKISSECDEYASEISLKILENLPEYQNKIRYDLEAAFTGDPAAVSIKEIILCYPFTQAIIAYRLSHSLYKMNVPFLPRMISEWAHSKTGIDIHPGATIGKSFFIDHGTGVVIGETTEIRSNVKLYQGVTLGALSFKKDDQGNLIRGTKRHPTLMDNVVVYANATILGGDTVIGENSIIGGNAWITHSIGANTKVTVQNANLIIRKQNIRR